MISSPTVLPARPLSNKWIVELLNNHKNSSSSSHALSKINKEEEDIILAEFNDVNEYWRFWNPFKRYQFKDILANNKNNNFSIRMFSSGKMGKMYGAGEWKIFFNYQMEKNMMNIYVKIASLIVSQQLSNISALQFDREVQKDGKSSFTIRICSKNIAPVIDVKNILFSNNIVSIDACMQNTIVFFPFACHSLEAHSAHQKSISCRGHGIIIDDKKDSEEDDLNMNSNEEIQTTMARNRTKNRIALLLSSFSSLTIPEKKKSKKECISEKPEQKDSEEEILVSVPVANNSKMYKYTTQEMQHISQLIESQSAAVRNIMSPVLSPKLEPILEASSDGKVPDIAGNAVLPIVPVAHPPNINKVTAQLSSILRQQSQMAPSDIRQVYNNQHCIPPTTSAASSVVNSVQEYIPQQPLLSSAYEYSHLKTLLFTDNSHMFDLYIVDNDSCSEDLVNILHKEGCPICLQPFEKSPYAKAVDKGANDHNYIVIRCHSLQCQHVLHLECLCHARYSVLMRHLHCASFFNIMSDVCADRNPDAFRKVFPQTENSVTGKKYHISFQVNHLLSDQFLLSDQWPQTIDSHIDQQTNQECIQLFFQYTYLHLWRGRIKVAVMAVDSNTSASDVAGGNIAMVESDHQNSDSLWIHDVNYEIAYPLKLKNAEKNEPEIIQLSFEDMRTSNVLIVSMRITKNACPRIEILSLRYEFANKINPLNDEKLVDGNCSNCDLSINNVVSGFDGGNVSGVAGIQHMQYQSDINMNSMANSIALSADYNNMTPVSTAGSLAHRWMPELFMNQQQQSLAGDHILNHRFNQYMVGNGNGFQQQLAVLSSSISNLQLNNNNNFGNSGVYNYNNAIAMEDTGNYYGYSSGGNMNMNMNVHHILHSRPHISDSELSEESLFDFACTKIGSRYLCTKMSNLNFFNLFYPKLRNNFARLMIHQFGHFVCRSIYQNSVNTNSKIWILDNCILPYFDQISCNKQGSFALLCIMNLFTNYKEIQCITNAFQQFQIPQPNSNLNNCSLSITKQIQMKMQIQIQNQCQQQQQQQNENESELILNPNLNANQFCIQNIALHPSGYHVTQRFLRFGFPHFNCILDNIKENFVLYATDHYGVPIIKSVLDMYSNSITNVNISESTNGNSNGKKKKRNIFRNKNHCNIKYKYEHYLLAFSMHTSSLVVNQYGNYVIQHLMDISPLAIKDNIKQLMIGFYAQFSKQKFSSNVVEKCLKQTMTDMEIEHFSMVSNDDDSDENQTENKNKKISSIANDKKDMKSANLKKNKKQIRLEKEDQRKWKFIIVRELLSDSKQLISHKFGNYCLQTALNVASTERLLLDEFLGTIEPHLHTLRPNIRHKWGQLCDNANINHQQLMVLKKQEQ